MTEAGPEAPAARDRALPRWVLPTIVGGSILLATAVGAAALIALRDAPLDPPSSSGTPASMSADGGIRLVGVGGGITVADPSETPDPAVPTVSSYVDWSCPACRGFEARYGQGLAARVAAGEIALEVHPVAILDRYFQGSEYSSRAANAAACVAQHAPGQFLDVQYAFFAAQPDEGTRGYADSEIVELLALVRVTDEAVVSCVENGDFRDWVTSATRAATTNEALHQPGGGFATPTILIDGVRWNAPSDGDLLALLDAR